MHSEANWLRRQVLGMRLFAPLSWGVALATASACTQGRVDHSANHAADTSLGEFQQSESCGKCLNEQRAAIAELSFEARSTKLAERPP
jgi:hypothetical protein